MPKQNLEALHRRTAIRDLARATRPAAAGERRVVAAWRRAREALAIEADLVAAYAALGAARDEAATITALERVDAATARLIDHLSEDEATESLISGKPPARPEPS